MLPMFSIKHAVADAVAGQMAGHIGDSHAVADDAIVEPGPIDAGRLGQRAGPLNIARRASREILRPTKSTWQTRSARNGSVTRTSPQSWAVQPWAFSWRISSSRSGR